MNITYTEQQSVLLDFPTTNSLSRFDEDVYSEAWDIAGHYSRLQECIEQNIQQHIEVYKGFYLKECPDLIIYLSQRPPPLTMSFTFDPDLFHYHRYNNIGDGSLSIIGVFSASSHHEYAIRLYYSKEQHLWLAECGPDFEQAVLTDVVLPFFEELYELYFAAWPEDQSADKEQRKIEIFSLYIMGLKQMWLYHG
ncbi:hypothetical protein EV421DRAFT_1740114 [Armillaria borealis]|uniref:Uncharacterized protein n=1 Tax=Armillaria borealis TaxID=47425 RepID=A0AA39J6F0_9AGAR|nr:hypothetical protein EV421DRAFT_1740114 [Armillaria borealis]